MFESPERLAGEIGTLLETILGVAGARYACVLEPRGIVFERPEPEDAEGWALRRLLQERSAALLRVPEGLASGEPMEDVFEGWERDEFFLAVINGRVALVVACPEAEPMRERLQRPIRALADRLFRYNAAYRVDARGRGLFFGRPKLDIVVIGRASS